MLVKFDEVFQSDRTLQSHIVVARTCRWTLNRAKCYVHRTVVGVVTVWSSNCMNCVIFALILSAQLLQFGCCVCNAERALYVFETSFHPMFSLTQGTSRLPYKHAENRWLTVCQLLLLAYTVQIKDAPIGTKTAPCWLVAQIAKLWPVRFR